MTEDISPRRSRGRNSSPELIARLQRSRQRSLARRAAEAEREKNITTAVGAYLDAWNAIVRIEQRRDGEVARLQEQIESVIAHAATEVAAHESTQASAAVAIRAQVHTDAEVADLLEITRTRVRQLLAVHRATPAGQSRSANSSADSDAVRSPVTAMTSPGSSSAERSAGPAHSIAAAPAPTSYGRDEVEPSS
ncbi:hypothetical protein [Nocardia sp. NPDC056000]|uniref:hypothetical protein n=1 Tax=Nocardia sp. NPDC056000 TaxID=3345674 RepID=UPI0035D92929